MKSSPFSIGIDTSHKRGQLCLYKDQELIENLYWEGQGSHSEKLNSHFQKLLSLHNFSISDLSRIYCSIGPGSFTGLRVGVNFCKTLSYSHNIELIPVNTLLCLAHNCEEKGQPILSTIDAQKNSLFISTFSDDKSMLTENQIVRIDDLNLIIKNRFFVCGSGIERYKNFIDKDALSLLTFNESWKKPDLSQIISLNEKSEFLKTCSWSELSPLYIRLSSAEEKLTTN